MKNGYIGSHESSYAYDLLQVSRNESIQEIKRKRNKILKAIHPDTDPVVHKFYQDDFYNIQEQTSVLINIIKGKLTIIDDDDLEQIHDYFDEGDDYFTGHIELPDLSNNI